VMRCIPMPAVVLPFNGTELRLSAKRA